MTEQKKAPVPEGRRYFLKVLERIEFEVTPEEYKQVAVRMLGVAEEQVPPALSFHLGIIDGWYVDQPKGDTTPREKYVEEVIDGGDRT